MKSTRGFFKNSGFTLIELMLVMAIAAVLTAMKMQDSKIEMTQLQAKKLGATELFTYNLGVQKYLSDIAGIVPATGDYPKVYTGSSWLKNDQCSDPALPATPDYVPCSFLSSSGGKTTMGAMSFVTAVNYDAASGYTARTVLSKMAGSAPGETHPGILGMAALVASGAFIGSDPTGSPGSIIYCPDITPMPAGMAAVCGLERDQIVMMASTNGNNDQWLRVDHGNVMQHAIEMSNTSGATPAIDTDLSAIHPNMRQIRNVARIYNVGAGSENLYLGSRLGAVAEYGQTGSPTTLASNAVIIDADQEVLGLLKVQGNVHVTGGNLDLNSAGDPAKGNLNVERDIRSTSGNATINGWIQGGGDITSNSGNIIASSGDIISSTGDVRADNGFMRALYFSDASDPTYMVNPNSGSKLNQVTLTGSLNLGFVRTEGGICSPNGAVARTSVGKILSCVSGKWTGGGGGKLVVSKPFAVNATGTNWSGYPMYIQGFTPGASDNAYAYLTVCGTAVNRTDSVIGSGGWSRMTGIAGIVPHGCSWNLTINGYKTTRTVYRYGQYIYIQ